MPYEPAHVAGVLTIVVFFDYTCPYCEQSEPEPQRLVKTDGRIRPVYKE